MKKEDFISRHNYHPKTIFLWLTMAAGIFILWPLLDFQHYLAQGDHGRDLYCFKKVLDGSLPYRDFSWLFGPLMPYYYGFFYLIGGISIQSVLLGQCLLIFLIGIFVYLTCATFLSPAMSFVCALWYWFLRDMEFFYTYNHAGGLLAIIVTLYCLFQYIKLNRLSYVYAGFISTFLLMLIRLNMGISILAAFVFCLFITDIFQKNKDAKKRRKTYVLLSFTVLGITATIYWLLLYPLPSYAVAQSFPYGKFQRTDYTPSLFASVIVAWNLVVRYFTATVAQKYFGVLIALALIQTLILIFSDKLTKEFKKNIVLVFGSLLVFITLSSHEFLASGVFYRTSWFLPLIVIGIFYLIAIATKNIQSRSITGLILFTLILPALLNIYNQHQKIRIFKNPHHLLEIGNNKIYTTQHPYWFLTVKSAVNYIRKHARPDEKILTLPLDPLYLFLSERDSATRQLVFFEHINIPEEQEHKTIAEMEENEGNWVILSSRSTSFEKGLGTFGKTYCPLLSSYIDEHFQEVAIYGDWVNPPGWAWHHGVRIYKRIK